MIVRRRFVRFLVLAFALGGSTVSAFAHAHPKTMTPAPNTTVSAPTQVSIVFSEAVDPKFSSLQVTDQGGKVLSTAASAQDPADHAHLTLPLPTLAPGTYVVKWVTSAMDGHHLEGSYTFMVK